MGLQEVVMWVTRTTWPHFCRIWEHTFLPSPKDPSCPDNLVVCGNRAGLEWRRQGLSVGRGRVYLHCQSAVIIPGQLGASCSRSWPCPLPCLQPGPPLFKGIDHRAAQDVFSAWILGQFPGVESFCTHTPSAPRHNPCQSESLSKVPRASGNIDGPNPGSKILVNKVEVRIDFMTQRKKERGHQPKVQKGKICAHQQTNPKWKCSFSAWFTDTEEPRSVCPAWGQEKLDSAPETSTGTELALSVETQGKALRRHWPSVQTTKVKESMRSCTSPTVGQDLGDQNKKQKTHSEKYISHHAPVHACVHTNRSHKTWSVNKISSSLQVLITANT